ncbi:hypothetical protein GQ457_01G026110 [Hibiscus cannabinus]
MAKTSDFALKLLDDLRLRKERMAASRSSKATNPMVADASAYSKTAYRSSREPKTVINTGSKAGSTRNSPSGGRKSVTAAPVSNQIVPFGRDQKSKKFGDPSSAVAFTVEKGGKLGRTEFSVNSSMFNFLHNIGRKQMDNGKTGRTNAKLHTISHLDIDAISRGVQKLNQILIACSNGLNFDRYSIEIGRELLKGAMDLDKSLRMLANLQEPSEYSTTKPRGSRITLLEEDDDDDDEKQLDISSFSLGRPLRNYNDIQDVARTDLMLRLKDLTYSSKVTTNSKHGKKVPAASNSHSHKQSLGYGPEIKTLTTFSEQTHSSSLQRKQEKLGFPNVIAKLMGLDELPRNVDSKVNTKESGKQPGKVMTNTYGSTRVAAHDKVPRQKDLEYIKPMMSSRKVTIKTDKQQSDIVRLNHNYASRKEIQEKERKHDNVKHREQKIAERSEIKELVFEDEMQQMIPYVHKRSEAAVTLQEKAKYGENNFHGFEQVSVLQKSDLEKRRRQSEERKEQSTKQKLHRKQKQNEPNSSNFSKPMSGATATNLQKKQPQLNQAATSRKGSTKHIDATHDGKHHKNQADDRSSINLNGKIQSSLNRNSRHPRGDQESESAKACIRFTVDEKPVQVQTTMKGSNLKVPRINEAMPEKGASVYNLLKSLKHQSSNLQERKQVRLEQLAVSRKSGQTKASRLKEVEPKIIRSNKSISSLPHERQKAEKQNSVFSSLREDECEKLNKSQALVRKDSGQTSVPKVTNEEKDQEPDFGRAKESQFKNSAPDPLHRTNEANVYEKPLNQRTYTSEMPEPLTESEDHFKQILMKSQLFMHTAKALFKVSIPTTILHGDGDNYHDQESKLILDCGYDVMKRKGRRQELSAHPFLKTSVLASNKAKSMDDMVKQMCKDFDKLKLYGREGMEDSSFEDYTAKMVEADINDKEPDLNCMWDLGWNFMMFACLEKDDVIRDVERYVLNELLVDITKDLLTVISVAA